MKPQKETTELNDAWNGVKGVLREEKKKRGCKIPPGLNSFKNVKGRRKKTRVAEREERYRLDDVNSWAK
jgi:hypothetical protein